MRFWHDASAHRWINIDQVYAVEVLGRSPFVVAIVMGGPTGGSYELGTYDTLQAAKAAASSFVAWMEAYPTKPAGH